MIILTYFDGGERTTVVGVFSSTQTANVAIQEFLNAYKKQETEMWGYLDESDSFQLEEYKSRFRMVNAELDQIVDRSVGFVYDWL